MDIGAWLRSLGLSRHESAFSDNSIDADVLPDLTDGIWLSWASILGIASASSKRSLVSARPT